MKLNEQDKSPHKKTKQIVSVCKLTSAKTSLNPITTSYRNIPLTTLEKYISHSEEIKNWQLLLLWRKYEAKLKTAVLQDFYKWNPNRTTQVGSSRVVPSQKAYDSKQFEISVIWQLGWVNHWTKGYLSAYLDKINKLISESPWKMSPS